MSTPPPVIRLLVHGASGRMGGQVLSLAEADPRFQVVAAVSRDGRPVGGAPGVAAASLDAAPEFDLAVDFSLPEAFDGVLALCIARGCPLVSGTTGLSAEQRESVDRAAASIPLVLASNFSLGVAVLEDLVQRAAGALAEWPATLVETHHVHKKDAPSGTALTLADAAESGSGRRPAIESIREGEVVGIHRLQFVGPGESLELGHVATDRSVFARGALHAGTRLVGRSAGKYRLGELVFTS